MRAQVKIEFQVADIVDFSDLQTLIKEQVKPILDKYHTAANISIAPLVHEFHVEGLWNG